MDRLPLRLLAFALGPLVSRRVAAASRKGLAGEKAPRQLRSPASTVAASEDASLAADLASSSPWMLASAAAAAVALAAVVASQERPASPSAQGPQSRAAATPRTEAARSADFGGV
jgi:hypothetical protein